MPELDIEIIALHEVPGLLKAVIKEAKIGYEFLWRGAYGYVVRLELPGRLIKAEGAVYFQVDKYGFHSSRYLEPYFIHNSDRALPEQFLTVLSCHYEECTKLFHRAFERFLQESFTADPTRQFLRLPSGIFYPSVFREGYAIAKGKPAKLFPEPYKFVEFKPTYYVPPSNALENLKRMSSRRSYGKQRFVESFSSNQLYVSPRGVR